jgi:hypothetical protein
MAITIQNLSEYLKKYPLAIGCGTLSVVLLAGLFIRSSRTEELAVQVKQKEQDGQRILDNVRDGANLPEQHEALAASVRELESRLIRGSERAGNQQYFYQIESETGVREVNLQSASTAAGPQRGPKTLYSPVAFTITVQGDYRQILGFLGRLETGPHFYRLNRGTVMRPKQGVTGSPPGTLVLTLNLDLLGLP